MLGCIALSLAVLSPPPVVVLEQQRHLFCEPRGMDACARAAEQYIWQMQMAGQLPGAREPIRYTAVCTTTI